MNPSEVDMSYEEAGWDGQGDEEEYEEGDEDPYEGEGQVPGGGGVDNDTALLPAEPEAGHFQPGVALDPLNPMDPPPPTQAHLPLSGPLPPPSPPLEPGEASHRREDRAIVLPDGSQYQMSRRSSRSRASQPPSRRRGSSSDETSEEEEDESSSAGGTEDTHPPPPSPPGPSSPRGGLSPPPDPDQSMVPSGSGNTGNTPGRNSGLGRQIGKVRKRLQEKWIVRKQSAPSPGLISPALPLPKPLGSLRNLKPSTPARPEEPARTPSPGSGSRGDRTLSCRTSRGLAAPSTPPALEHRSRRPPDRYQAGLSSPATKTRKDGKVRREKKP